MITIPTGDLPVHPVADLFPMLADDELAELAADIKQRGQIQAIVMDDEGRVLDGRNRLAACRLAGVEPTFATYDGNDPDGYALAVNIVRRHLSTGARAIIAAKAARLNDVSYKSVTDNAAKLPKSRVAEAALVLDWAPDLADAIVSGAQPLSKAIETARDRKTEAERLKSKMDRLHDEAGDLAALVDEGRMGVDDAIAALEGREEKARQELDQRSREEREREQLEAERRRRLSAGFAEDLVRLASVLDPDPLAFLDRTWDPHANPHREMASVRGLFTPAGLRRIVSHLSQMADHLDDKKEDLL